MYKEIIIPTSENHIFNIPEEFYGEEVIIEVTKSISISDEISRIRGLIGNDKIEYSRNKYTREELNDYN